MKPKFAISEMQGHSLWSIYLSPKVGEPNKLEERKNHPYNFVKELSACNELQNNEYLCLASQHLRTDEKSMDSEV